MMELTIDFVNTIYSGGVHAKENLSCLINGGTGIFQHFLPFFPT